VVVMGIAIGLVIANIVYAIHRFFPTNPDIDTAITLISPYIMYITAEHFKFSGVLSVVCGGLFLSYRSQEIFSYETRISAAGIWSTLTFLLNGFVFILIGLQLPGILSELEMIQSRKLLVMHLSSVCLRLLSVSSGSFPVLISQEFYLRVYAKMSRDQPSSCISGSMERHEGRGITCSALAIPLTLIDGTFSAS
jgi:CPA1 family monovalent cation:H+ antiporter